jgi:hypothetical protein
LGTDPKKHACYDIDVEVDDPVRDSMRSFLSPQNTHELEELDGKVIKKKYFIKNFIYLFYFRFFNILIVLIN